MDPFLIGHWFFELGTWEWVIDPGAWLVILEVVLGLGMVIFVHELGHFAVAKLCGVKCEKFYLGFDIAGYKLCKFRKGETEYGIGILPLGGYVKMLGQEDNPSRLKEELERAKTAQAAGQTGAADKDDEPLDIAAAEAALYDPRSYLAKSVPKRMAIISAGVIMNLIFAVVTAAVAYGLGVEKTACEVGNLQPGSPAWQADLRPGDRIVEIGGEPVRAFDDLKAKVFLSKRGEAVPIVVERPGLSERTTINLHPDRSGLMAMIGIGPTFKTTLLDSDKIMACLPGSPAAAAQPAFKHGDRIVAIDDVPIADHHELRRQLASKPDGSLAITVERLPKDAAPSAENPPEPERVAIEVAPRPMRRLGLVMTMGPIAAIQEHSPAVEAGLMPGDRITAIDDQPVGDPMTLADRLRRRAGETVSLSVERHGKTISVPVALRPTETIHQPPSKDSPIDVPALGVAIAVGNTIAEVLPGSPADRAGVKPGAKLVQATIKPPDKKALEALGCNRQDRKLFPKESYEFDDEKAFWPAFFHEFQGYPAGTKVELTVARDGQEKMVTLEGAESTDWFNPERGFRLEALGYTRQASSLGEAISLGAKETWESATQVLLILERLRTGDVSPKSLGGPVMIARAAGARASMGLSHFLLFLTLLGANLAVLNFLPIPVLDGGHMVFLAWEGIRGKPADERVQIGLSYVGLLLLVALMVWVFALDFAWIPRE
ncbi:MAG: site-2 protease family protein [Pirellulales bacterium]|nr:site-2 protease family protein [Pirellulales bacterium]